MASDNIKVCIKIRPLIEREKNENAQVVWRVQDNKIKSLDGQHDKAFGK